MASKDHSGQSNKIDLVAVVNGLPIDIEANVHEPLLAVVGMALAKSENVGQPPENWEVKDEEGNLLDVSKKIGDLGLTPGAKIFISLKAGVTG